MTKQEIEERINKYFEGITPEELLTKMIDYGFEVIPKPHVCEFKHFTSLPKGKNKGSFMWCKCGNKREFNFKQ